MLCVGKMLSVQMEQRVNIKFLFKLGKSATEAYSMLQQVYGDDCLSRTRVFEWFKRFQDGREDISDDLRTGRPCSVKTDENIERIGNLVRQDRRLTIRAISELTGIDKECVRQILHDSFNMNKVCSKLVPKCLTAEQKESRKQICSDILENIENDATFLERVITCDESWFFIYDPETKRQSMHWKSPNSPRQKKARMTKSKFKAMMVVFFDIRGIVHIEWVPEGQTVNQKYYISVLRKLRERVRRKRQVLWKNKSWILHQDNAPAHTALSVKTFLAKYNIPILDHPPYSPDLAPCDFFLFPKVKAVLKGTRFESVEAVKEKATEVMNSVSQNELQHCFAQWKVRMEHCRDRGGEYIEGDNVKIVNNNQ